MFSWKNLQKPELFSIYPKSVNKNWDQRKFNRKFRNITRDYRPKERALGPRLERWKWHRFLDGNFSSFRQKFDDLILIPAGSVLACIVVLGMFIVQLDYVDEYHYRQFMMIMLVVLGLGTPLLRAVVFYGVRIWVVSYGQARIEDAWILNSYGQIEDTVILDEFELGEWFE